MLGEPATEAMLNKSLFFISIGSNDIFGYFGRNDGTPPDSFIAMMISAYSQHITVRVALSPIKSHKFFGKSLSTDLNNQLFYSIGARLCTGLEQENSVS